MNLVSKVEQTIEEENLMQPGDVIVVAVSGGPDSAALLHILFALSGKWRWQLVVAHVDHMFRGEESRQDAQFVKAWARRLGLPCEVAHIDLPFYIEESGANPQAAARDKRYAFLHEVAAKYGAGRIALAHHADDQAETVLMRMIRGTGPSGLAGIPIRLPEKNVERIRPLLRIYKSEILQYCQTHSLAYRLDRTNLERKYFRNQVRLDILPQLARYNPRLPEALNRLAESLRAEDAFMETETRRWFDRAVRARPYGYALSRDGFLGIPLALQRRLIKLILSYLSGGMDLVDFRKLEQIRIASLQKEPANLALPVCGFIEFRREYGSLQFRRTDTQTGSGPFDKLITDYNQSCSLPHAEAEFRLFERGDDFFSASERARERGGAPARTAVFDWERLALPLRFRSRKPGDRLDPLGLNGSKKVKDIFIDAKIPPSRRERIPLLVDAENRVLWIPGLRRSRHALITGETRMLLEVSVWFPGPFEWEQ